MSIGQKRAIVLDDDGSVLRLLTRIVEGCGYSVLTYSSPGEATVFSDPERCPCATGHSELFAESSVCGDLIITDIDMPGINGIEYVRKIRGVGCGVRHVAVLSGKWDQRLKREAEELGCRIFEKPSGMSELRAWVRSLAN